MTAKLALLAVALLVVWAVLFRPRRRVSGRKPKPPPPQALEPCPRCGVFRLPAGACDCDPRSTSED